MVVSNKVYTFVLEIYNTHYSFLKMSWSMKDKYSFFGMLIR